MSISAVLLAAHLATAGQFSMAAAPAAIHGAQPNHTYQIRVTDTGHRPMLVKAGFLRATADGTGCRLSSDPATAGWAHFAGPHRFRLQPGESRVVRVRIGQPPAGQTELVAAFSTKTAQHGSVSTNAGVGTAIRFARPGHTEAQPCARHVTATVLPSQGGTDVPELAAGIMCLVAGGSLWVLWRRRHRYSGRHSA